MSPWPMSHSRTLPSVEPDARYLPLGENASEWIGPYKGGKKSFIKKDSKSNCSEHNGLVFRQAKYTIHVTEWSGGIR